MHALDRLSSMSLVPDRPLIQVNGRVGVSRASASGTVPTTDGRGQEHPGDSQQPASSCT